jgi:FtsZ-binding cell division protein ZapB
MSIEKLSEITKTLTDTVKTADNNYKKFSESNQQYQQELEKLRNKLASANESLGTFEKFKN